MCGHSYKTISVRVVRETANGSLLYFKCTQCRGGLVASVMDAPFGLLGSGLMTDLQYDEVERYAVADSISEDDVLDVHTMLSQAGAAPKGA